MCSSWAHRLLAGTMLIGGVVYGRCGETALVCFDEGAAVAGFSTRWNHGVFHVQVWIGMLQIWNGMVQG